MADLKALAEQIVNLTLLQAQELKQILSSEGNGYVLVDVRNPHEYEIAKIPGSVLVPLPEIENGDGMIKMKELANGNRLLIHCKSGMRSAKAIGILKQAGVDGTNVKGGILAWSREIDPSVPEY